MKDRQASYSHINSYRSWCYEKKLTWKK